MMYLFQRNDLCLYYLLPTSSLAQPSLYTTIGMVSSKDWTDGELTLIAELYPTTPQLEMLKAMPIRTWNTIYQRAYKMGIKRQVKLTEMVDRKLTWNDLQFLEENGLTVNDFAELQYNFTVVNQTGWLVEIPCPR